MAAVPGETRLKIPGRNGGRWAFIEKKVAFSIVLRYDFRADGGDHIPPIKLANLFLRQHVRADKRFDYEPVIFKFVGKNTVTADKVSFVETKSEQGLVQKLIQGDDTVFLIFRAFAETVQAMAGIGYLGMDKGMKQPPLGVDS